MKELKPCPKCIIDEAHIEKEIWYVNNWDSSCIHKYIITCPNCGFEMRRNGKKHRQDLISRWNNLFQKNFDIA